MSKYIDADLLRKEIERRLSWRITLEARAAYNNILRFLDTLPEQPVSDHHEIEVEFRGEKVTISREFYRDGEMNYSTSEQDDNAIWSALRAWCEKKGITPFELYPKTSGNSLKGLEEEIERYIPTSLSVKFPTLNIEAIKSDIRCIARHFAEWGAEHAKQLSDE